MLLEQDMLRLQQEAVAVREALVLRETRAETLQEDLALARASIAQTTGQQEDYQIRRRPSLPTGRRPGAGR